MIQIYYSNITCELIKYPRYKMEWSFKKQQNKAQKCDSGDPKLKDIKKSKLYNFSAYFINFSFIFTDFWYLWILTPASYIFGPYFAVFQSSAPFCTWGTLLGHNQCWKGTFRSIDIPACKFLIMLSSGLLVAFLVLEFELKSFSTLLGPNDPKKVKKL